MPIKHQTQSQLTLTSRTENLKKFRTPWWNRRTRLERSLIILLFVTSTFTIAFLTTTFYFGLILKDSQLSPFTSNNVCLTPGCIQAASEIIANLNESVDPCDNFYEFACGGWLSKQFIGEDRTSVSYFSKLGEDLNIKLRKLIEDRSFGGNLGYMTKIRNYYDACRNTADIEMKGSKPLIEMINKFGGWPVLKGNAWDESKFNWLDLLIEFRKQGYSHDILFDISVTTDFRNNSRHIIELDQASLGVPDRSYILRGDEDPLVKGYKELMMKSAILLGGVNTTQLKKELDDAFKFEAMIAKISIPREERRNYTTMYNKKRIRDIKQDAKNTNWMKLFKGILDQPITEDQEVIVQVPAFIKALDSELPRQSKRTLANYMIWRLVLNSMITLNKEWVDNFRSYSKIITGQDIEEPRWEQCLDLVNNIFGIGLSSLYVRYHFDRESKKSAQQIVNYIRDEFIYILNEVDWADKKTVDYAILKAKAIKSYIGFPEELLNDTLVEEFYKDLNFNRDESYLEHMLSVHRWALDYSFSHLFKPSIQTDWKKHAKASTINAFYNLVSNSIEFPSGILQNIFFNVKRPAYLNYGSIGFIIGHEITHAFDDRGRQFDKFGQNYNWWTDSTDLQFRQRAQCLIDQYSNYVVPEVGVRINGFNTQGENIADCTGLRQAYRAYQRWVRDNHVEPSLPGLKYTNGQLFFISAANIWCSKTRPEFARYRLGLASHSPSMFRVIGPMSNTPEFAKQFNCPVGSPMNPLKKCVVW